MIPRRSNGVPDWDTIAGIATLLAMFAILLGIFVFWAWVSFFADCRSIDWMPISQTPARCIASDLGGRR